MSSLEAVCLHGQPIPIDCDTDEELFYEDQSFHIRSVIEEHAISFPIDEAKIARPQPGGQPSRKRDSRAPPAKDSTCPGCRHMRSRDDWTHTREIGQCAFPYDMYKLWKCEACQQHKPSIHKDHTFELGDCKAAETLRDNTRTPRTRRCD